MKLSAARLGFLRRIILDSVRVDGTHAIAGMVELA